MFLAVFIGSGVQLGSMLVLTLVCACLGFMDTSYRGSLVIAIILFYNFMGIFAGYYSARIYKMFNVKWKNTLLKSNRVSIGSNAPF
jgi:transmembrane 9 superfamily protein 2/4